MKFLLAILVLLFGYLQYKLWITEGKVQDSWKLEQRLIVLREENSTLTRRNNALQAEVTNLKSGLDVIEKKARNELGFIRPNETFFQYIEPENAK